MEIVKIEGVSKSYSGNTILDSINFSINAGEIVGFIGKSGSGKSTLLNLLTGLEHCDKGKIVYSNHAGKGLRLTPYNHTLHNLIGYMPQHKSHYPDLTIMENLLHFGYMYKQNKSTIRSNATSLLRTLGLFKYSGYPASSLSGGMARRLDIACSMIHKPRILFLDEPISNLDAHLKSDILSLIKQINLQGVTVVIASHDLDALESLCTNVYVIANKKVVSSNQINVNANSQITLKPGRLHDVMLEVCSHIPGVSYSDRYDHIVINTEDVAKSTFYLFKMLRESGKDVRQIEISTPYLRRLIDRGDHAKR